MTPDWQDIKAGDHLLETMRPVSRDVDEVISPNGTTLPSPAVREGRSQKLIRAGQISQKTAEELGVVCEGLNALIDKVGAEIQTAYHPHGPRELLLTGLGRLGIHWAEHQAAVARQTRLHNLSFKESVDQIGAYVKADIQQLGESEQEYKIDIQLYQKDLDDLLAKQSEATPKYREAKDKREALQKEIAALTAVRDAASEADRPKLDHEYEAMKRDLDQVEFTERTQLAILSQATQAIPELRKASAAAAEGIKSLHASRQQTLEKFTAFRNVLGRASTQIRARNRMELHEPIDAALNRAVAGAIAGDVATAGGLLEVWAQRAKHAAIDPEQSQALLLELLGHIGDFANDLNQIEGAQAEGVRMLPMPEHAMARLQPPEHAELKQMSEDDDPDYREVEKIRE